MELDAAIETAVADRDRRAHRQSAEPVVLTFSLPWPPSANHYYGERAIKHKATGKWISIRYITHRGRRYRTAVIAAIAAQKIPTRVLTGRLDIDVIAFPPDRRDRDLDNLWKCMLDAIKHVGVIVDDSHFDHKAIDRGPVVTTGTLKIRIAERRGEPMTSFDLFDR